MRFIITVILIFISSISFGQKKDSTTKVLDSNSVFTISVKDVNTLLQMYYTSTQVSPKDFDLVKIFAQNLFAITEENRKKILHK